MASPASMSELRKDKRLARFVLEGALTGKALGSGCFGTVEEAS